MNRTTVDLLQLVKQYGLDTVLTPKADSALNDLFFHIPIREITAIEDARGKYHSGHGRDEFDKILNTLIQKYRHDPPNRKLTIL